MDMNQLASAWAWFANQSIGVQALVVVAVLNISVAGLRALGWTWAADICIKIEDAIQAMIAAAKTQALKAFKPTNPPAGS